MSKVLNETPGIFTTPYAPGNGNPSNGASPGSEQTPQIRGALPYETESLIDGHPVSVGSAGTYSPNLINPFLLHSVELVKGPGSMPVEINYAINGTVNYLTLQPTATNAQEGMFGIDKWGGVSAGFKMTGETANHKLGYALGYVTDGAPGPLQNFQFSGSQLPLANGPPGGPYYVNGRQLAMIGSPIGEALAPPSFSKYAGMGITFAEPLVGCCYTHGYGLSLHLGAREDPLQLLEQYVAAALLLRRTVRHGQRRRERVRHRAGRNHGRARVCIPAVRYGQCRVNVQSVREGNALRL